MSKPFYAYMLRCRDGSYYVGHTDDLQRRLSEHEEGGRCEYTTKRRPVELVWSMQFETREEAKAAEDRLKGWSRAKKDALVRCDLDNLQAAAKKDWDYYRKRRGKKER